MNYSEPTSKFRMSLNASGRKSRYSAQHSAITTPIFALLLLLAAPTQADPIPPGPAAASAPANDAGAVNGALSGTEAAILQAEELFNTQKKTIEELQKQIEVGQVLQNKSDEERKALAQSMNAQVEALNTLIKNWREYEGNVHALQAEENAKKYLPWGYAAAALLLFKKDAIQDKALVGLAGYGTGALIEQSNLGLGHFGVRTLFKMGYKF